MTRGGAISLSAAAAALLWSVPIPPVSAAELEVTAYDAKGRLLDAAGLASYLGAADPRRPPILVTALSGRPLPGRPWWVSGSEAPAWRWDSEAPARVSLPWPVAKDGYSTVVLDNDGRGYAGGRSILLNEEIAVTAYRQLQTAHKARSTAWEPAYRPSKHVAKMLEKARKAVAKAHAVEGKRKRAKRFDEALTAVSFAWQQMLFEHSLQIAADKDAGARLRFGLSLDETLPGRLSEFERLADAVADSGANWVRLVFAPNLKDFAYAKPASFALYDKFVDLLAERKIEIMGSVLDSLFWPGDLSPEAYARRAGNLARRYQGKIRSWEVASEPNGSWLGGEKTPLPERTVLLAVRKAALAVKGTDPGLETVATLHWWEGTAPEGRSLFEWLDRSLPRGFGRGIDVVALSVYPDRHPLGLSFDPVFAGLARRFPDKRLMIGGFSFGAGDSAGGYWWLEPDDPDAARKDLVVLYATIGAAAPRGLGGGFFWPTLSQMLPPGKAPTPLYRLHRSAVKRLRSGP